MTFDEAKKIFEIWQKWFWPCHPMLNSFFLNSIPESFLPYPKDILNEALEIIREYCSERGNHKIANAIVISQVSLKFYDEDKAALELTLKNFSDPRFIEIALNKITNFKKDWLAWLEKLEKAE